ncbi:hypothetical protein M3Y95_00480400 [Aphelenchoides besseyi]|nr:hypothetical protein M3Y95_00480400 [Aphelenchoides besseyi]
MRTLADVAHVFFRLSRLTMISALLFHFLISVYGRAADSTSHDPSSSASSRPTDESVLLSWRTASDVTASDDRSESTASSLDVLETLLHLRDVHIQVGAVGSSESPSVKSSESLNSSITNEAVLSTHHWPSSSFQTPPLDLENIERAMRLKAMAVGTEELLYKTLLDDRWYELNVRPTYHHTVPTNITFGFLLNQIVEMDERNQKLTTRCWLNVNWLDKRLTWNASHWDGIKQLYIPYQKIWRPDITLVNNAFATYEILSTDVMVTSEGNVTWLLSAMYISNCAITVKYYPFDEQICYLKFASWSHDMKELDLGITTEEGDLSSYMNNSEFDLLSMTASRTVARFPTDNSSSWATIEIRIQMKRRPLFYAFNHVLPLALISSMSLLGFFMPPETGEKINTLSTVLIAVTSISDEITSSIPPSSEAVPLIGMYYVSALLIVCLAITVNVLTLNIHRYGNSNQGRRISPFLEKVVLGYLASILFMNIREPDSITLLKTSQSRLSTLRRKSLMRDLKKSKNLDHRNAVNRDQNCECINAGPRLRRVNTDDLEIKLLPVESSPHSVGETAFLGKLMKEQLMPRIQQDGMKSGPMLAEFEERFKRILKRIYRSLQQNEIREEIIDERRRIMWQWHNLANVLDRLLLLLFLTATIVTVSAFMLPPTDTFMN